MGLFHFAPMFEDNRYAKLAPFLSEERRDTFDRVLENRTRQICLVLENVYQSRNASAVMRSCDGMGIQDVHLIEDVNPWTFNRVVSKGTPAWLTLHRYPRVESASDLCIAALKEKGYKIAVTSPHADGVTPHDMPVHEPIALVMGTEWSGVSPQMLAAADYHVFIPMRGFAESLNISVAAGMAMYTISERIRTRPSPEWKLSEREKEELKTVWAMKSIRKAEEILKHFDICPSTGRNLHS